MNVAKLRYLYLSIIIVISLYSQLGHSQIVPLQYQENKSFTWNETINYYKLLDKKYKKAWLVEQGTTDIGKPLHLFFMYGGKNFKREVIDNKSVPVLLVMNGIHPGEPDGIDASLLWAEWLLSKNDSMIKNVCICIIPVYNIDGALNRSCCSRVNQDGPEQYGFRGNAKNLDLNRDFIKMDTRNTESFVKIFQWLQPDLFIDTHVSNGADYQYTFTLLTTQKNKLEKGVSDYLYSYLLPKANNHMVVHGWPVAPYVNGFSDVPDSGLVAFNDSPRYSTGYAALFNTPGFVLETHMLKPFRQRVEATLDFLMFASLFLKENGNDLKAIRKKGDIKIAQELFTGINFKVDKSKVSQIEFWGYEAGYKTSLVTGKERLYYDTQKPYKKNIPMWWEYVCTDSVKKPVYYLIPQAWTSIITKLELNGVKLERLPEDQKKQLKGYKIISYKSSSIPYEGHHMKKNIQLEEITIERQFYKGDILIKTGTRYDRFLATVLEPVCNDSYFAWGFFDSMLQQKEWFSDYVWEDKAYEILEADEKLMYDFQKQKLQDTAFANSSFEQLYYIYKRSPYFEQRYMEYPIYKGF